MKRFAQKGICCCTILSSEKDTTHLQTRGNPLLFTNLQLGRANTEERVIYRPWLGNKWQFFANLLLRDISIGKGAAVEELRDMGVGKPIKGWCTEP